MVDRAARKRFRDGDPEAVRAVYHEYGRLVYAVAIRVLGDRGLAEEATQQTFVKAWRAAGTIDDSRDLGPWLLTIVRRTAIDLHRRELLRTAAPLDAVPADDPALVSLPASPESIYETWEVRRAVEELPPDEREVVRLQHFEGLTHGQIAERMKLAVGTVKSRSFRAHSRLATLLGHLRE
jgi:RNA polymerase sigma factor (sigma-70 family)